jgi:hypothetical protein
MPGADSAYNMPRCQQANVCLEPQFVSTQELSDGTMAQDRGGEQMGRGLLWFRHDYPVMTRSDIRKRDAINGILYLLFPPLMLIDALGSYAKGHKRKQRRQRRRRRY